MRTESSDKAQKFKELVGPEAAQGGGRAAEKPLTLLEEFSAILDKISLQLANSEDFAAWTKVEKIQQLKELDKKPAANSEREEVKAADTGIPFEVQSSEKKSAQADDEDRGIEMPEAHEKAPENLAAQEQVPVQEGAPVVEQQEVVAEQADQEPVESQVAATFQLAKAAQPAAQQEKIKDAPEQPAGKSLETAQEPADALPQQFQRLAVSEKAAPDAEVSKKAEQQFKPSIEPQQQVEVKAEPQVETPNAIVAQQQLAANAQRKTETSELLESIMRSVLEVKMQELPVQAQTTQMTGKESLIASLMTRQLLGKSAMALLDSSANSVQSANQNILSNNSFAARTAEAKEALKENAPQALPKPLEARTMRQVEQVVKEAAKSKDGKTISMRLDPPELGSLKVDVSLRDSALHARISAESAQVLGLLREKMSELQNMLRNLGLEVDSVSVSVQGDSQGFSSFEQEVRHNTANNSENFERESSGGEISTAVDFTAGADSSQQNLEDHWVA